VSSPEPPAQRGQTTSAPEVWRLGQVTPRKGLSLTETGNISRMHGREVVDATRAVLLSGLSGELLPASAYKAQRFGPSELGRGGRYRQVLVERPRVPLTGLDLDAISDKRAFNLPDEAQAIVRWNPDSRPCFLECFILVYGRSRGGRGVEIWFPGVMLKDTPPALIEPYLEPFGFMHRDGERAALADLANAFEKAGCRVGSARLGSLGNPVLELTMASLEALGWSCHWRSLAYYIGTQSASGLPICEVQSTRKGDNGNGFSRPVELDGHSLQLIVRDAEVVQMAGRVRELHDAIDACYRDGSHGVTHDVVLEALARVCPIDDALALAKRFGDGRLLSKLNPVQRG
jgi:hypothetical protein